MQRHLQYVSKDPIAEVAILKIKTYPVICRCNVCTAGVVVCPVCSNKDFTLVSKKEFLIEVIEVI